MPYGTVPPEGQTAGDCLTLFCNGTDPDLTYTIADPADWLDDMNDCTTESCDSFGETLSEPVPDGTPCGDGGTCSAGACSA